MQTVLVLFKNDGERRDFPLAGEMTTIGRDRSCALRIPKAEVSRQHCVLQHSGGAAEVRDTGSTNGTFVNGVRVEKAALNPGDEITIGPATFVIQIDGQPAEVLPPGTDAEASGPSAAAPATPPAAAAAGGAAAVAGAGAAAAALALDPADAADDDGDGDGPLDLSGIDAVDGGDDSAAAASASASGLDLADADDDDDDGLLDLSAMTGAGDSDDSDDSGLDLSFLDDDDD